MNQALLNEFTAIVGKDNILEQEADKFAYSYDAAVLEPVSPSLVVRPADSEALSKVVRL